MVTPLHDVQVDMVEAWRLADAARIAVQALRNCRGVQYTTNPHRAAMDQMSMKLVDIRNSIYANMNVDNIDPNIPRIE